MQYIYIHISINIYIYIYTNIYIYICQWCFSSQPASLETRDVIPGHRVMEDNPLVEENQCQGQAQQAQLQSVRSIAMNLLLCAAPRLAILPTSSKVVLGCWHFDWYITLLVTKIQGTKIWTKTKISDLCWIAEWNLHSHTCLNSSTVQQVIHYTLPFHGCLYKSPFRS